jgi:hypothetical protein
VTLPWRLLPEPMSVKAMLRKQGLPLGGAIRANYTRALDDCLWTLWLSAIADTGDVEVSACILWDVVSRDPSYSHPYWLSLVFKRHKAAIIEAHHQGCFKH